MKNKVLVLENAISQKSPVNEVEYAFDDRTPFSLYDCIIPKLKEHRVLKFDPRTEQLHVYNDNIAKATAISIEKQIKQMEVERMTLDNAKLNRKVIHLNQEMKIVDWYMNVMEKGLRTPKEIMEQYAND